MRLNKNLLLLHFTIFIWGFTAVLGALIRIPALELVWYRMLIGFTSIGLYLLLTKKFMWVSFIALLKLLGIGMIVALHWLFFFGSIKISTVSVALVSLSSAALFTSLLDPLFNPRKFSMLDLLISLCIIGGIYLIFHFESKYTYGILMGLASALAGSVFTIINENQIKNRNAAVIGFYEMLGGFLLISLYLMFTWNDTAYQFTLTRSDLLYLLILGTICTAFAYVTGIKVMKQLSAYTVILTTNLEPVYGILLAFLIFGNKEKMTIGFYAGAVIILAAVFLYPVLKKRVSSPVLPPL